MGGTMEVLRARTKKGLEEKTREWTRKYEGRKSAADTHSV